MREEFGSLEWRMEQSSTVLFLVPIAYVLGTFPSAILIARANGVDIAKFGSGNPGASNVTRALGWRKGIWVYVLDAVKGALAAGMGLMISGLPLAYWCGAAAIVGHMFPVFRHFRGGKGVATGSGVLLVVQPLLAPLAAALWWIVTKLIGKAAIGSVVAVAFVPIGLLWEGAPAWEFVAVAGCSGLLLVRHWSNFGRMIRREEHTMGKT